MSRPSATVAGLSAATEDYLRAILTLAGEDGMTTTTVCALADRLAVGRASASQMVRRLADLGLVSHDHYGAVGLTAAGLANAGNILRRYLLLESYLVATLGYDPDTVASEADRIEHAMSPHLTERLADVLSATQG